MQHVGWKLVRISDGAVVQEWGGVYGRCAQMPNPLILPTGDQICAPVVGVEYSGYRLDAWMMGPPASAVKLEAQRRILALTNSPDLFAGLVKQMNANMRTGWLNDKRLRGQTLTIEEEAEAAALRTFAAAVMAIRERCNEIEALDPIPSDYDADSRWPA